MELNISREDVGTVVRGPPSSPVRRRLAAQERAPACSERLTDRLLKAERRRQEHLASRQAKLAKRKRGLPADSADALPAASPPPSPQRLRAMPRPRVGARGLHVRPRGLVAPLAATLTDDGAAALADSPAAAAPPPATREASAAACAIQHAWRARVPTSQLIGEFRARGLGACAEATYPSQDAAFEAIAPIVQHPKTVNAAASLLRRLEETLPPEVAEAARERCAPLAARVAAPHRAQHGAAGSSSAAPRRGGLSAALRPQPEWHPTRVLLSAYMIVGAPEAVMGGEANAEAREALAAAAAGLVAALRDLIPGARAAAAFEAHWAAFLAAFDAWKRADAAALEADLTRAACTISASATLKLNGRSTADMHEASDLRALADGARADVAMLRSKALNVGGAAGAARFDAAVGEATRAAEATVARERAEGGARAAAGRADGGGRDSGINVPGLGHVPRARMIYELLHDSDFRLPSPVILRESEENTEESGTNALLGGRGARVLATARRATRATIAAALRGAPSPTSAAEHVRALAEDVREATVEAVGNAGRAGEACAAGLKAAAELLPDSVDTINDTGTDGSPDGIKRATDVVALLTPYADRASATIIGLGAPVREAEIEAALCQVSGCTDAADAVASLFEVLHRAACAIAVDAANAGLGALAAALGPGAGASYVRSHFAEEHSLAQEADDADDAEGTDPESPPPSSRMAYSPASRAASLRRRASSAASDAAHRSPAQALPTSLAWIRSSRAAATEARASLQAAAAARAAVPQHIQSGRAMSYGQLRRLSARSAGAAHSRPAEAAHDTWWECAAGPLRIGLVEMAMGMLTALRPREGKDGSGSDAAEELVSALDKPVELCEEQHALIPETLEYEALRMLQSAEALRRCVCLAAALLAAKQARAALRKPALPAEAMGAAASRAMALLRGPAAGADSGVVLEDVARELALAVDENESGTSTGMIARLLSHHLAGGAIAKRCVDAVRAAARAVLALGPVAGMEAACCALASVGASTAEGAVLAEEVGVAAAQLESIARVQLAVHGRTYASLLAAEDIAASEGSESEGEM